MLKPVTESVQHVQMHNAYQKNTKTTFRVLEEDLNEFRVLPSKIICGSDPKQIRAKDSIS